MTRIRVRGIYATALTERLGAEAEIVQASPPIRRRFDESFETAPHDVAAETTDDRLGVGILGHAEAVERVRGRLADVAIDALSWVDDLPLGAVRDAVVTETLGSGAVLDLGSREGFLPYDAVEAHVEEGDRLTVQVHDPAPPWGDRRPAVGADRRAFGGIVDLVRDAHGVRADVPESERADELARMTEILGPEVPDGWGVRWRSGAADVGVGGLETALADVVERVEAFDADNGDLERGTAWAWFGRASRFALDDVRRRVTSTMPGHHRIKAGADEASTAVDFVERLWPATGADQLANLGREDGAGFPFEATVGQFGPDVGEAIEIVHGKPDGRAFSLGRADVRERDGRTMTVRRELGGGGAYDALGTPKEAGDVAVTKLREGRWWYPTTYRSEDGTSKGTYVNVCTPVELFPTEARYVDLHVDVVKPPDGPVERVDDDELDDAVDAGEVGDDLAAKARSVATAVERALS